MLFRSVVLVPGEALLNVLESTRPEKREQLPSQAEASTSASERVFTAADEEAEALLRSYGVLPAKAAGLVVSFGASAVIETVDYLADNVLGGRRKNVANPAGLIIYSLENRMPIPAGFISDRKRKAIEESRRRQSKQEADEQLAWFQYRDWKAGEEERVIKAQYSDADLESKLAQKVLELSRTDVRFARMAAGVRREMAQRLVHKELSEDMVVATFEEWRQSTAQGGLFN